MCIRTKTVRLYVYRPNFNVKLFGIALLRSYSKTLTKKVLTKINWFILLISNEIL